MFFMEQNDGQNSPVRYPLDKNRICRLLQLSPIQLGSSPFSKSASKSVRLVKPDHALGMFALVKVFWNSHSRWSLCRLPYSSGKEPVSWLNETTSWVRSVSCHINRDQGSS